MFRADLTPPISRPPRPQAAGCLEHAQELGRGFACLAMLVASQRDPLAHSVSSPENLISEPAKVTAVLESSTPEK